MVSQTYAVEPEEQEEVPLRTVARNTSEFAEDILTLAELQARLLVLESKDFGQSVFRLFTLGIAGIAIVIGLIPIGFLTITAALVEWAGLSFASALIVTLGLGLILGGSLLLGARSESKTKRTPFYRSSREWDANLRWVRDMLRRQGRRW